MTKEQLDKQALIQEVTRCHVDVMSDLYDLAFGLGVRSVLDVVQDKEKIDEAINSVLEMDSSDPLDQRAAAVYRQTVQAVLKQLGFSPAEELPVKSFEAVVEGLIEDLPKVESPQ